MSKFKVGDRVRRIGNGHVTLSPLGREVTVVKGSIDTLRHAVWYENERGDVVWSDEKNWELVNTSPVRTITKTRKEIVPGTYGAVKVLDGGDITLISTREPAELRAAAATFIELADALDGVA